MNSWEKFRFHLGDRMVWLAYKLIAIGIRISFGKDLDGDDDCGCGCFIYEEGCECWCHHELGHNCEDCLDYQ